MKPRVQLKSLAKLRPRSDEARDALLENLHAIACSALERKRSWLVNGEQHESFEPDHRAATEAYTLAARVLLLDKPIEQPEKPGDANSWEANREELRRHGYDIVPVAKG